MITSARLAGAMLAIGSVAMLAIGIMPAASASASTAGTAVSSASVNTRIMASGLRRLGTCRARGDFATCVTSGSVNHPRRIYAHVHAGPRQHVTGNWNMVCSKGTGAGGKMGTFSGTTPIRHKLRMPYSAPDSCTVAAGAELSDTGTWIRVSITART